MTRGLASWQHTISSVYLSLARALHIMAQNIRMTDIVSFKAFSQDPENKDESEVRRFVMEKNISTSFSSLEEILCEVFPHLYENMFSITWSDKDEDMVTIVSDEELSIALPEISAPVYKLVVTIKRQKTSKKTWEASSEDFTSGVSQENLIQGNRLQCKMFDDFGSVFPHDMVRFGHQDTIFPKKLLKRIHKM